MSIARYPSYTLGDLLLTSYPYGVVFGGDHGAPETVTELVQSMLADGDLIRVTRHGNRELTLTVIVEGADLGEVALNEATLRRACSRPNVLTFDPGDDFAPASAFDVLTVEMRHARDEETESHLLHKWELTLTCAPFARSTELTTVEAMSPPPASPTTVTLHDCSTTTGWSAVATTYSDSGPSTSAVAVNDGGPFVWSTITGPLPSLEMTVVLAAVSLTATPYLVVETSGSPSPSFTINGAAATPIMNRTTSTGGTVQYVFDTEGVAVTSLRIAKSTPPTTFASATIQLGVYDISATDTLPHVTSREVSRIFEVGGTERTTGSIKIGTTDDAALGVALVHTSPVATTEGGEGYDPSLRRWRTSGNTVTAQTSRMSGATEPLYPAAFEANVPNHALPEGPYALVAMIYSDTTSTERIHWAVHDVVGGHIDVALVAGVYTLVPIAVAALPSQRSDSVSATTTISLELDNASTADVWLDDAFLFWASEDCGLTVVTGTDKYLWLEAGTTGEPRYWTGNQADGSDRQHPGSGLMSPGSHPLTPGLMRAWVGTSTSTYAGVEVEYFEQWHSSAAR